MRYSFSYGLFHWIMHYFLVSLLVWVTNFHLLNVVVPLNLVNLVAPVNLIPFNIPSFIVPVYPIDLFMIYTLTTFVDWDHIIVYKKFGRKGIFKFAQKRITYPLHNFFFLSVFGIAAAFSAILFSRTLAIILLVPVVHLLWDMLEDVFIFRTTYRKWEKTWGIGSKELEETWKEWERYEKQKGTS